MGKARSIHWWPVFDSIAHSSLASSPQDAPPRIAGLENAQTLPVEIATLQRLALNMSKLREPVPLPNGKEWWWTSVNVSNHVNLHWFAGLTSPSFKGCGRDPRAPTCKQSCCACKCPFAV
jgi:hypothetical protein